MLCRGQDNTATRQTYVYSYTNIGKYESGYKGGLRAPYNQYIETRVSRPNFPYGKVYILVDFRKALPLLTNAPL